MTLLAAIQRIQTLAISSSDIAIKYAPDAPVPNAMVSPFTIAYVDDGEFTEANATDARFIGNVNLDAYFNPENLPQAFKNMDLFTYEFVRRLGGDPTLNGTVQTIVFPIIIGKPSNVTWGGSPFLRKAFTIKIHTLETPLTTST